MQHVFITIGAPGSGKSTYLENLIKRWKKYACADAPEEYIVRLNADELRGLYGKDETDQSVSGQAFNFIAKAMHVLLRQGFSVAIDVTSKDVRARAAFIQIAKKYNANTTALVFDTPLAICQARNAARNRVVPPEVVEGIFNQIVHPIPGEFDKVTVVSYLENYDARFPHVS